MTAFEDNFTGTGVDTTRWNISDGKNQNNATMVPGNVAVTGGELRLKLSDASTGAMIHSGPVDGRGTNKYQLKVGEVAEARVLFPGDGSQLYNWPAWWVSGDPWALPGENDIAEELSGQLTVNYHYGQNPNVTHANQRPNPAGYWGDTYHTYTLHRLADRSDVYWDGKLVHSYTTYDNGGPESLILTQGNNTGPSLFGDAGALRVDYVKTWKPAP